MSRQDRLLSILDSGRRLCDDCLSDISGVKPRQSVRQTCSSLRDSGLITRVTESCEACNRMKITNAKVTQAIRPHSAVQPPSLVVTDESVSGDNSLLVADRPWSWEGNAQNNIVRFPKTPNVAVVPEAAWGNCMARIVINYDPEDIFLVSCVATKSSHPCEARDMYTSTWFKKARRHVEEVGLDWFVLSARYGLIHPNEQIEPYELTLNTMPIRERKAWANRVFQQIKDEIPGRKKFVFLAGARYREFLLPLLEADGAQARVPMIGLTQGRQMEWFDTHQAHVQA